MTMPRLLLASFLLALSSSALTAPIFTWTDERGVTHYGAQPPQGHPSSSVALRHAPSPGPASAPRTLSPAELAAAEQQELDTLAKREQATREAQRKQQCSQMRGALAQLRNSPRIRMEIDGELRRLSEEERQAQIDKTRENLAEHCD
jgi:hypothetical protein